jgi:hypothetical protein
MRTNKEYTMHLHRCRTGFRSAWLLPAMTAMMLMACIPASATESIERSVSGTWRVTSALDAADVSSLDERDARRLIGHVFTISREKVKFEERDCGPTEFQAESVEPRLHLREEFRASADKLNLPNPVTVVDLSCTSVFIRTPDRLVIAWKGWFFDAVRVRSKSAQRKTE